MNRHTESAWNWPIAAWGAELRTARWRQRSRRKTLAPMLAGMMVTLMPVAMHPVPRLVWNASASAPIGLYAVAADAPLHVGDMVIAWAPLHARRLAAERQYLPLDVPLVKHIMAGPGDRVCARGRSIFINGRFVAERTSADRAGRPLPEWFGCRQLGAGQYLLLNRAVAASFDGRYFGPTDARDIIGKAALLWAR